MAITDKFNETTNGSRPVATTVTATRSAAGTVLTCAALTGWPTATAVHFITYQTDASGNKLPATQCDWKGVVSGSTITNLTLKAGTDNGNAIGDTVVCSPTAAWADDVVEGIAVSLDQDGTIKAGAVDVTAVLADDVVTRAKINDADQIALAGAYLSQGQMVNGYIDRTVASNNITVAIKTLAGTNPSSTDPVYVRVGNTVRAITAALSVTKNAGTNWFNSGSTQLATYEIDYFVYIGYNATDGVTIGFARIPYANTYADFSTTTTDEKYCAISTITTAASTDQYENIGRFNATLSATASFNWSIPATSLIINRPIFETRILTYASAWTSAGTQPALGNAVRNSKYLVMGRQVSIRYTQTNGTTTTYGTNEYFGTPFTHNSANAVYANGAAWGTDVGANYYGGLVKLVHNTATFQIYNAAAATNSWGQLVPFTWGNTDIISATLTIDIA